MVHQVVLLSERYDQDPVLALKIIKCESRMNPESRHPNRRNGKVWSTDIGFFQLNDVFHKKLARTKGFDIYDPQDNLEYGIQLMAEQGMAPWKASFRCIYGPDVPLKPAVALGG